MVELPSRKGRGRPAEYCGEHAKARKREQDKARRINSREPESIYEGMPQCCIDWQKAGRSNRTICPQHKTWRAFVGYVRDFYRTSIRHNGESTGQDKDTIVSLIETGRGVRVSADPDSWNPADRVPAVPAPAVPSGTVDIAHIDDTENPLGQMQMSKTYKTETAAFKRQRVLMRSHGICPGVIKDDDGCYHLTFDPDVLDM